MWNHPGQPLGRNEEALAPCDTGISDYSDDHNYDGPTYKLCNPMMLDGIEEYYRNKSGDVNGCVRGGEA